jgi:hypothetical protein
MTTHRHLRGNAPALVLAALGAVLLNTAPAHAQRNPSGLPSPRLYTVSPAGGKVGNSIEVTLAGLHFEEPERIVFSHPGIKGDIVPTPPPEIDPKTKKPKPRGGMAQQAAGLVKCRISIAPGTPLGNHDVRLIGKWGASNPRTFMVGDLNEIEEKEPNNDIEQAQRLEINTTVNGTINNPTDVDYYVFKAAKGQRILLSCLASTIDSRLQPAIEVYSSKDRQIAANRNYNGYDALADFTAPEDGDYFVRVFQFTHTFRQPIPGGLPAGASDNFYRLSITTAPWIDAIFPSVIEPGKTVNVTVYGRNLPDGKLEPTALDGDVALEKATVSVTAPADGRGKLAFSGLVIPPAGFLDGFEVRLKNAAGSSNPFLITLARAPVVLDRGAGHDTPESAQQVMLPCEIAGQVEKRRDRDWYSFTAKKGETWNIEVSSNRLGAPTYMMFLLRNPATRAEMFESPLNENMQRHSRKFFTRSEDPGPFRFTAPADGQYQLLVASRSGDTLYGPRHYYQVRITRDEADFRLVAMSATSVLPDAATVSAGGHQSFSVLVEREAGFANDIELTVEGLPPGVTCPPQTLAGGARQATLVVSATPDAAPWAGEVKIKGTAMIEGNKIVREARAGSILWPVQPNNNIITISRLDRSLVMAVRGKAPFTLMPALDKPEVPQGGKAVLTVKLARLWPDVKGPVQVQIMGGGQGQQGELPQNLRINNNQPINVTGPSGTLNITVGNDVPPGTYNLVLRGQTQAPFNKDATSKAKQNTFLVQPSAPISFTVLPKSLATFTVSNPSPTIKIGNQMDLVVRVNRQFNFKGEFKVQLVLPPGANGVEAGEVVIPAGKDEAKLVLRVPPGANPGGRGNLLVRATAMYGKSAVVHEAKLNVNVVK